MPFIAFLGCDGSGKSTIIARIEQQLKQAGHEVRRGHWRPDPLDAGRDTPSQVEDPHGIPPRGALTSIAKLGWLWLSWWMGWLRGYGRSDRTGYLLFDRYHADLLVDPQRYRYGGPMALARIATAMMPQPDVVIFLDAEPDTLHSRKQEVPPKALAHSRKRYLALCQTHQRFHVIDASHPVDEVVSQVSAKLTSPSN